MENQKKERKFNPWQSYFMIAAGISLLILRFIGDSEQWSTINLLRVAFGAAMIGYGTYRLIKKK